MGEKFAEESGSGEGFVGWDIAAGCHDDVRVLTLVVACPVPDSDSLGAVLDCFFHIEVLDMVLLVGNDDVDVVGAAETMICDREESVSVRWEVDSHDFWALVCDNIEETRILMGEAVVVLSPDGSCEKDVEGGDLDTPFDFIALLNPFAVLVDHRVDDVNEGFVTVEKTMSS